MNISSFSRHPIRGSAIRFYVLVLGVMLAPHAFSAVTVTGTVTADDTQSGGSTTVTTTSGDLTFGPQFQISILNGQVVIDNGSTLTAGSAVPVDFGTFIVTGAQSRIDLIGDLNRLDIQGQLSGFQILNGGMIDATGGICGAATCNVFLGNFAGSQAAILIDGAGSQLNTINTLFVANGNTDFGISGASSSATIDILNGGAINAQNMVISQGLSGGDIQAGQFTLATVNIDGLGSVLNALQLDTASGIEANANINVTAGGVINASFFTTSRNTTGITIIQVDGIGSQINTILDPVLNDLTIGEFGFTSLDITAGGAVNSFNVILGLNAAASGAVSIDGIGSQLLAGNTLFLGEAGTGSVDLLNGGTLVTTNLTLGNTASGLGSVNLDGIGSTITTNNAFVGNTGQGIFDVTGGATLSVTNALVLGAQAGGSGSLNIIGAGSSATVDGLVNVGFVGGPGGSPSTILRVQNGGLFTANTNLFIEADPGGFAFTAVEGTGSILNVVGVLAVGDMGEGTFDINTGGVVNVGADLLLGTTGTGFGSVTNTDSTLAVTGSIFAGISGGSGTLLIDGGIVTSSNLAIGLSNIGVANTTGSVSLDNSAQLTLPVGSQLLVGGGEGASGSLFLDTNSTLIASQVFVGSNVLGSTGDGAFGSLSVANGATLFFDTFDIGFGAGSGLVSVDAFGTIDGPGPIRIGFDNPTAPNNGEVLFGSLLIGDTGTVRASEITITQFGELGGTGDIDGNVTNNGGLVFAGGESPGVLLVNGDFTQQAGTLQLSAGGTGAGQFDQLFVRGDLDLQGGQVDISFVNNFIPLGGESLPLLVSQGTFNVGQNVAFNVGAGAPAFQFDFANATVADPVTGAPVASTVGTFSFLNANIAITPGLTVNDRSLATAIDNVCVLNAGSVNPSPDRQDLLQICAQVRNAGNTPEQVTQALDALGTEEVTQTFNSLLLLTIPQHGNLSQRINGIRGGSSPFDFSGLNLQFDGHQIAGEDVDRFIKGLIGGAAGSGDEFAKWGFFGNGNINFGDKDATDQGNGFDYETLTVTMGTDYRARDSLIFGGSISYSDVNADFDEGGGLNLKSWAATAFGSYFKEQYYVDLLFTYGRNEIDISRHVIYQSAMGSVNRRADSDTEGDQFSTGLGFGYDFTPGAWVIGPHGGGNYTELSTDAYVEKSAQGLNLAVNRQNATSFTANLGLHASRTFTPEWGVIIPYLTIDAVHEFEDDSETIEVRFAADLTRNDPVNPTPIIRVDTDKRDKNYYVISAGVSVQLIYGIAGFLNYRTVQSLADLDLTDITWGIRFEQDL